MTYQLQVPHLMHKSTICFYMVLETSGKLLFVNHLFKIRLASQHFNLHTSSFFSFVSSAQLHDATDAINKATSNSEEAVVQELLLIDYNGKTLNTRWELTVANDPNTGTVVHAIGYETDIQPLPAPQANTTELVDPWGQRYEVLAKISNEIVWDWNPATGDLVWSEGLTHLFQYPSTELRNNWDWWYNRIHPDDLQRVTTRLDRFQKQKKHYWFDEYRFKAADNNYIPVFDRSFKIYDANGAVIRVIGSMQDLTERKKSEEMLRSLNKSLQKRAAELAESNAELERFAYIASHDLQEPLRMVSSFLQLLQRRYKDKLDQKGNEYISFAVDGAERMKILINDLLEYSRVNTAKSEPELVDLNTIAHQIEMIYQSEIAKTKGSMLIDELPSVMGVKSQLYQLLQNLVGNALKYSNDTPPQIRVGVVDYPKHYEFFVSDNGIGIEPRFFNKIFVLFQRLHHKDEYSGTGIGLAICKKIVERHGGSIWVQSEPHRGSTFFFTIPKPNI